MVFPRIHCRLPASLQGCNYHPPPSLAGQLDKVLPEKLSKLILNEAFNYVRPVCFCVCVADQ